MRALLIQTSPLRSILHTFPAVGDAVLRHPTLRFDWVVEQRYADVPSWHPAVDQVLPVDLRRWRSAPLRSWFGRARRDVKATLFQRHYDCVIEAEGHFRSAWLALFARGPTYGLDGNSAPQRSAALFYRYRLAVPQEQHLIDRQRQLLALALDYEQPSTRADFGLSSADFPSTIPSVPPFLMFLPSTRQAHCQWPIESWRALCALATAGGFQVLLPSPENSATSVAECIAEGLSGVRVLPALNLQALTATMLVAQAVVSIDSSLASLPTVFGRPVVVLYGSHRLHHNGVYGEQHRELRFAEGVALRAGEVWTAVTEQLDRAADGVAEAAPLVAQE